MWEKLETLSNASGASGRETQAAKLASEYLKPLVDNVETDSFGNIYGFKKAGADAKTLLIDAHIDEIGIMITGQASDHLPNGFLKFITIGGIDPRMLMAREFRLDTGHYGVVACLPPHVQDKDDSDKAVPVDELFLDTGLDDASCIPVGTVGVFDSTYLDMGAFTIGKAFDDRACFAVVLRALEFVKNHKVNIAVVGSAQEEVGFRGATVAGYSVKPDYCVVLDVTHGRTPDAPKDRTFAMGGGPCIGVAPSLTRSMGNSLKRLAKENDIPYQIEVMSGGTCTNDWTYQISRDGIQCAVLSLPLKYMHSPIEMLNKDDFENTAKLLAAFIEVIE